MQGKVHRKVFDKWIVDLIKLWNHLVKPERDVYVWPSSSSQEECQKENVTTGKFFHKVDVHFDEEGLEYQKPQSCSQLKQCK